MSKPGRIVILNGAPRSGKSSIVAAMQARDEGIWLNLGVDLSMAGTPKQFLPGIGLRPGGERPDLETIIPKLYAGLYESVAANARLGLDVIVDIGHHDGYSQPLGILPACARRLARLPVLFVGIVCPIASIMARRNAGGDMYLKSETEVPLPVARWQMAVHQPGIYDLTLDTSELTPQQSAEKIIRRLEKPTAAFKRLSRL